MLLVSRSTRALFWMPFFVLLVTRLGIELSVRLLPMKLAWIPAFGIYYLCVEACLWFSRNRLGVVPAWNRLSLRPLPPLKQLLLGIILPALLPLGVLVSNYQVVPPLTLVYILVFACINPFFEEVFWRGLVNQFPLSAQKRQFVSAFLFSFSHYFLWGSYWLANPNLLIPTCLTTFIMGWCWMWFYQRDGRLIYPVVSHIVVDIFNLSIAIFMGIKLAGA